MSNSEIGQIVVHILDGWRRKPSPDLRGVVTKPTRSGYILFGETDRHQLGTALTHTLLSSMLNALALG